MGKTSVYLLLGLKYTPESGWQYVSQMQFDGKLSLIFLIEENIIENTCC